MIPDYLSAPPRGSVSAPVVTRPQELPFGELTWENFEKLCYRLASVDAEIEHCQPYGLRGQDQKGIDLYAKPKRGTKHWAYQCKRENAFGPAKIRSAVSRFLKGSWAERADKLILCTKESLLHTKRAEAIEEQREILRQRDIVLVVWDSIQLSRLLKDHPSLVRDFFGEPWVQPFCSANTSSPVQQHDVPIAALANNVKQLGREWRWTEILPLAEELEQCLAVQHVAPDDLRDALLTLAEVERHAVLQLHLEGRLPNLDRLESLIRRAQDVRGCRQLQSHASALSVLRSVIAEITVGADAALAALGPPVDQARMRATLGVLVRADRFAEAAARVSNETPDEQWIDLAARANARLGESETAQALLLRADESSDLIVMRRTRLGYVEGMIGRWQARHPNESLFARYDWADTDRDLARHLVELLEPLVSLVRATRRIGSDLEFNAVIGALYCAHVSGDRRLFQECCDRLFKHMPLPKIAAELCLRRLAKCPNSLVARLRGEHIGDFQASYLAALVERELLNRPQGAFEAFQRLAVDATSDAEKESVCIALFETCGMCGGDSTETAIRTVTQLRPHDSRLLGLLKLFQYAGQGDVANAEAELEAIRDEADGAWWQAKAHLCEQLHDEEGARIAWERASELLPHPKIVARSVQASLDRHRYQSAARGLRALLERAPEDVKSLDVLAWTLVQLGDHIEAAACLRRLVDIEPSNSEYRLRLAQSLARCNRAHEGTVVLEPICADKEPPVEAVLLQSELLQSDGRALDAFAILDRIAAAHWDDPHFLLTYMRQAHSAEDEKSASNAFARLIELRRQGHVSSELMQEGTLEELLDYSRQWRSRRESLQTGVVSGRLPWLLVEEFLGNPAEWAWTLHTQDLRWLSEERLSRAAYSIYSTNCFTVCADEEGRSIRAVETPPLGTEIVVDLTALLTLHRLGRLEEAADLLGGLVIPARYGELRVLNASRFGRHQPSRETELKRIRSAIEKGRLQVTEDVIFSAPFLDEYADTTGQHVYRLRDLIAPLRQAQKVNATIVEELIKVAHRGPTASELHPPIDIGAELTIDFATLRTLANQPAFDVVLSSFSVRLQMSQHCQLLDEIQAWEATRAAHDSHESLWKAVNVLVDRGKVRWMPLTRENNEATESDDEYLPSLYLDAMHLAYPASRALLADDRVLQAMMYQGPSATPYKAFGSDQVLLSLLDADKTRVAAIASDFLRLVRWRYRFLVPSSPIMVAWALESLDNLPGDALLDIANYMHDCLRDPGLHCGLEASEPPMPMAAKLVTAWISVIAQFVAHVWSDGRFTDSAAIDLTRWVGAELIPSPPEGLWLQPIGINIARSAARLVLTMAMVPFTAVQDRRRANLGLRTLRESLGTDPDMLLSVAAEAIHAII